MAKKTTTKWGAGGITGGGTKYEQMGSKQSFTVHPEAGLNRHKPNVKTDKPYDSHIDTKK